MQGEFLYTDIKNHKWYSYDSLGVRSSFNGHIPIFKRLNYNWSIYPSRFQIIQNIINKKKFEDYLEIGCDEDANFSKIKVKNKDKIEIVHFIGGG